jgi:septum formation protein
MKDSPEDFIIGELCKPMKDIDIILASKSPRRQELLKMVGIDFKIIPSECNEDVDFSMGLSNSVKELSLRKAKDVATKNKSSIVIGSDTIVGIDGKVLCKPKNEEDAFNMLKTLSGREHIVYTGLAIVLEDENYNFVTATETKVKFFSLTDDEIINYIKTGEPMDKAGAYGIQGKGAFLAEKIEGDYYSVMGLPVALTVREIENLKKR